MAQCTPKSFDLTGKVALITGASYGIGMAIAKAMAANGATSVFNDIKQELVDKGLASYAEAGIKAYGYVCALCPGPVDTEFNERAAVVFALRGISPELCVEEAMRGMLRRKTIIVPSALMRAATTAQRFMPMALLMPIMAHQQKKKLG